MVDASQESAVSVSGPTDDIGRTMIIDDVGDMAALESQIDALDRQLQTTRESPVAHKPIQRFHNSVKVCRDAMKQHQEEVGST